MEIRNTTSGRIYTVIYKYRDFPKVKVSGVVIAERRITFQRDLFYSEEFKAELEKKKKKELRRKKRKRR